MAAVIRRWLGSRSVLPVAVAVACLLCAPSLWGGLSADDWNHRTFVLDHLHGTNAAPNQLPWWNMFEACGRDGPKVADLVAAGLLPWWTSPTHKIAFLRPLSVASHYLDYLAWPDAPWLMHLHNVALYAAITWLAAALYFRLLGARALAGIATLLFAIDEAHAEGVSWIANRNAVLTTFFALLTLFLFDRARRDRSRVALWLTPLCLLCGHASSEGAVAVWGYLGAYALCIDRAPVRDRLLALAPLFGITLAWLTFSAVLGFGVHGSGIYVDPRRDPVDFLRVVVDRLPDVLRGQLLVPLQVERAFSFAAQRKLVLAAHVCLAAFVLVGFSVARRSATARFFALGMLASALVVCAGGAEPRILFLVSLGAHGLVAELIGAAFSALPSTPPARRLLPALVATLLLLSNGPLAAVTAPLTPLLWPLIDREVRAITATLPSGRQYEQSVIVILNTNHALSVMLTDLQRATLAAPGPRLSYLLSASPWPVRLTRSERDGFELEPEQGFLAERTSTLVRSPRERFRIGEVVPLLGLRVEVRSTTLDGRPKRIHVDVADAENANWLWVAWNDRLHGYERVRLPSVGGSLVLPGSAGAERPE